MHYLAYSGGKDSTALALVYPEAIPVFTDTGWEFPEIYQQIEKFQTVTGREIIKITPDETLPEYILRAKYLPGHHARFCTRIFKIDQYNKWVKAQLAQHPNIEISIGLRADEEYRPSRQSEIDGVTITYPLRDRGLGIWDVIRICLDNDLLPRYPVYMARGGCIGCFYKRKSEVLAMAQLVPDILGKLQEIEEGVQDERGKFAIMFPSIGTSIANIRKQPALFDMTELYQSASQRGDYGQNCGLFCGR